MKPDLIAADFQPQGYFDGRPYRFDGDGAIYSIVDGRVVRFTDFEAFVTIAPREQRLVLPALLLTFVAVVCVSLLVVQRYYNYLPFIRFEPHLLVRACVNVLPALGLVLLVARG